MTQTAVRLTTTVLPGKRIEFTAPDLAENDRVELIIWQGAPTMTNATGPVFASALTYLDSLPRITRTPEDVDQPPVIVLTDSLVSASCFVL